jgi:hypothetical protein
VCAVYCILYHINGAGNFDKSENTKLVGALEWRLDLVMSLSEVTKVPERLQVAERANEILTKIIINLQDFFHGFWEYFCLCVCVFSILYDK